MSFAVSGSHAKNPFAALQQLQQLSTPGSSQAGSDPLSALLAAINQTGAGTTSSANGASSPASGGTSASGGTAPQFGQQTLQTLLAFQANDNGPVASLPIMSPPSNSGPPGSLTGGSTNPLTPAPAPATTGGTASTASDPTSTAGAADVLASPDLLNQLLQKQSQLLSPSIITQSITV